MTRRPHGVVYGLLAVSVAVNLIGAGYLGYASFAPQHRGPRTVESTIDMVSARFPKAAADAVRSKLEARRPELKAALDEMKQARRETRQAIRQEPLDKDRVEAAFAASRDKNGAFQRTIHSAIVEALPDLPESERGGIDKDDD